MITRISFLMILITGLTCLGCSKKSTEPPYLVTSTFPLSAGTWWRYQICYRSSSDSTALDSVVGEITRRILGPDTLNGLIIMDDSTVSYRQTGNDTSATRYWCSVDVNSFSIHAIDRDADGVLYPVWNYDQPHVVLDFPLTIGKTWDAPPSSPHYHKQVLGKDTIIFQGRTLECDVIYSEWDGFFDDYPINFNEWYTNDGLMAKQYVGGNPNLRIEILDYSIAGR